MPIRDMQKGPASATDVEKEFSGLRIVACARINEAHMVLRDILAIDPLKSVEKA
jgi:hypothetical protein